MLIEVLIKDISFNPTDYAEDEIEIYMDSLNDEVNKQEENFLNNHLKRINEEMKNINNNIKKFSRENLKEWEQKLKNFHNFVKSLNDEISNFEKTIDIGEIQSKEIETRKLNIVSLI